MKLQSEIINDQSNETRCVLAIREVILDTRDIRKEEILGGDA